MFNLLKKQNIKTKYKLKKLLIEDFSVGWITPYVLSKLEKNQNLFRKVGSDIEIISENYNFIDLSKKINDFCYNLYLKDKTGFDFWCNEKSCIENKYNGKKYFYIERAATGFLGLKTYGVHLNGFKIIKKNIELIIAKRSCQIKSYPNLLDSLVAGFLPMNCNPKEKIFEEAYDEAGISKENLKDIKFVSFINFIEANEER